MKKLDFSKSQILTVLKTYFRTQNGYILSHVVVNNSIAFCCASGSEYLDPRIVNNSVYEL
jgi:hypothetical protein